MSVLRSAGFVAVGLVLMAPVARGEVRNFQQFPIAVSDGQHGVKVVPVSQLSSRSYASVYAWYKHADATLGSGCDTSSAGSFVVSVCENGGWICAAVHTKDGATAGSCVNADDGRRFEW